MLIWEAEEVHADSHNLLASKNWPGLFDATLRGTSGAAYV